MELRCFMWLSSAVVVSGLIPKWIFIFRFESEITDSEKLTNLVGEIQVVLYLGL
jgi:hypothetical protein